MALAHELRHLLAKQQKERAELKQRVLEETVALEWKHKQQVADLLFNSLSAEERLKYWYTPLKSLPGYDGLPEQARDFLRFYVYLGDTAMLERKIPLREPNLRKAAFNTLEEWLQSFGAGFEQYPKEYKENQTLLRYFDEKITHAEDGLTAFRKLRWKTFEKLSSMEIHTVGQLATSEQVYKSMGDTHLMAIERYLGDLNMSLHLGMSPPYRPEG